MENVKSDATDKPSADKVKSIDTEYVKPVEQPSVTVPESNIPQQAVREVSKNDSRQVEKDPVEQPSICSGQQSSETPLAKSEEKMQTLVEKTQPLKEKKIEKIIFFYDDDSFKVYHP